ncbi:MAG: site-specific DNA-methyltransferase [Candidatus Nanoarchaeia archaeon]|nr:site-specific DNA-methyltransferase [Candidatus Nanoarchaeia archaeon]
MKTSKIHLGNCIDILNNLENESIDLIVSDPPYGISYLSNKQQSSMRTGITIQNRDENYFTKIQNDEELPTEYLSIIYNKLKNNSAIYLFCHWRNFGKLQVAVEKVGFTVKNMIVMNKSNHGMGDIKGSYAPKHELVLFASKGRHILNNINGRINDVLDVKVLFSGSKRMHPNEKPIGWIKPFILNSSKENDIILDMFMGSGSTGVACVETNRKFIGIEIDNNFFNIAKNRLESVKGKLNEN